MEEEEENLGLGKPAESEKPCLNDILSGSLGINLDDWKTIFFIFGKKSGFFYKKKAKKEKNYSKADEIRNLLKEKGIELIDQSTEITKWIRI